MAPPPPALPPELGGVAGAPPVSEIPGDFTALWTWEPIWRGVTFSWIGEAPPTAGALNPLVGGIGELKLLKAS
jgi:hypothetical protein